MPPTAAPTSEIGHAGVDSTTGYHSYQSTMPREDVVDLMWPHSVRTYDRIRRTDSKVASSIRSMMLPLLAADWRIDPRGARPEVTEMIADALGLPILGDDDRPPSRTRDRFDWGFHLRHALLSRVWGFTPFEQVARVRPDGFVTIRKLAVRMPHTVQELKVADDGGLDGIVQSPVGTKMMQGRLIPIDRLVMYVHDREGYDWRGNSILRPVYREFLLKDHAHRVGATHIDRNGSGVPIITDDPAGEQPAEAAANQRLAQAIRSGTSAGGRISSGATAKILGVSGQTPDIIAFIRMYDEAIAQNVLDNFSSLPSAPNGSRALGTSMVSFFARSLNSHGDDVGLITTNHVVEDLVDWNWGPEENAPAVVHGEIGADQELTAVAIQQLIQSKAITPDPGLEAYLRRYYHLPALPEVAPAPAAPVVPVPPPPAPVSEAA